MATRTSRGPKLSRRAALRAGSAVVGIAAATMVSRPALGAASRPPTAPVPTVNRGQNAAALLQELDAFIEAKMAEYHVPGVAIGVWYQGQEYVRGYGITNVDYPQPVDGDTLFRIGSTTKTFTGTTAMRLVEQGRLDLAAPVRRYLPGLRLADEATAARVTVHQLLNHSAGWLGEYYQDFGRGADALTRYVPGMQQLPQLTPAGQVFSYNNAAVVLAGHVIEAVADKPYEDVVREQVLGPLGLDHSFFFSDEIVGYNIAAAHDIRDGVPVVQPSWWHCQRTLNPTGGVIASIRDLLRYARFHLGDGQAADGTPVLSPRALRTMRSDLGPGGTLGFELVGVGINWFVRRTAEGVPVVESDGDWLGQSAGCLLAPDRDVAVTVLTNSPGGGALRSDLLYSDWALARFAGLRNPPAAPRTMTPAQLAPFEGEYWEQVIAPPPGYVEETVVELRAVEGRLRLRILVGNGAGAEGDLAFYRDDDVVMLDAAGQPTAGRVDFVRGADGRVAWFRNGGRLSRRLG